MGQTEIPYGRNSCLLCLGETLTPDTTFFQVWIKDGMTVPSHPVC